MNSPPVLRRSSPTAVTTLVLLLSHQLRATATAHRPLSLPSPPSAWIASPATWHRVRHRCHTRRHLSGGSSSSRRGKGSQGGNGGGSGSRRYASPEEIDQYLEEHVYGPQRSSDRRKTSAFEAKGSFLQNQGLDQQELSLRTRLLTYGEMPIASLAEMLTALDHRPPLGPDDVFVDIGSGCGRLVLAAAMLYPFRQALYSGSPCAVDHIQHPPEGEWTGNSVQPLDDSDWWWWMMSCRYCAGIEILGEMHTLALDAHTTLKQSPWPHPLAPCVFLRDDVFDPTPATGGGGHQDPLSEATICYCYSTTWSSSDPLHLSDLSTLLASKVRADCTILTTDKMLSPEEFDTYKTMSVINWEVGGDSTIFFARRRDPGRPKVWGGAALS